MSRSRGTHKAAAGSLEHLIPKVAAASVAFCMENTPSSPVARLALCLPQQPNFFTLPVQPELLMVAQAATTGVDIKIGRVDCTCTPKGEDTHVVHRIVHHRYHSRHYRRRPHNRRRRRRRRRRMGHLQIELSLRLRTGPERGLPLRSSCLQKPACTREHSLQQLAEACMRWLLYTKSRDFRLSELEEQSEALSPTRGLAKLCIRATWTRNGPVKNRKGQGFDK